MDRRQFLKFGSTGIVGMATIKAESAFGSHFIEPPRPLLAPDVPLTRLAFGSCNHSTADQRYWQKIAGCDPQLWIWLGDNIYGDGLMMWQRAKRYQELKNNQYYRKFRDNVVVIGTWDDHDYAWNNHDGGYWSKEESKQLFVDFLDISPDTGIAEHHGIYQSYTYGPEGQRTKVILLDLRFNQDRDRTSRTLLGAEQWQWLRSEVATDDFDLLIIGSSLNVSAMANGRELEGWQDFPAEKIRLETLITSIEQPVLILSGDRHQAEFARWSPGGGSNIYEFMSSGLTHYWLGGIENQYRVGEVIDQRNFGFIEIDWSMARPSLNLQIRSPESGIILRELRTEWSST